MPEISRFYGIRILMFFTDHNPPHFHVEYSGVRAVFTVDPLGLDEGDLPARARRLVVEWAREHKEELVANWDRARRGEMLVRIRPLE